jgi:hypothetical protein
LHRTRNSGRENLSVFPGVQCRPLFRAGETRALGNNLNANVMKPLVFPQYSRWEWFLRGFPFIGADYKATQYFKNILIKRNQHDTTYEWQQVSEQEREIGLSLIDLISQRMQWDVPCCFIPDDDLEVVLWDKYGDMALFELFCEIRDVYHMEIEEDFEQMIFSLRKERTVVTFRDFIRYILNKRTIYENEAIQ